MSAAKAPRAKSRSKGSGNGANGSKGPNGQGGGRPDDSRVAAIVSKNPNAPKLVMAGGTTAGATAWLRQIAQAPLAGRVEYLGYVSAERREELFRGARALVMPSFEEGFGLPALDAMAAGVPVVASNRGALPEVLGDTGLLVDPNDAAGIAHALERMVSDTALRANLSRRGADRGTRR